VGASVRALARGLVRTGPDGWVAIAGLLAALYFANRWWETHGERASARLWRLDEKIDETFFTTVKWLRYSALKWTRGLGMNLDSLSAHEREGPERQHEVSAAEHPEGAEAVPTRAAPPRSITAVCPHDGSYLPTSSRRPKDVIARKALRKSLAGQDSVSPGDVGGRFLTRTGLQGNDRE